MYVLSAAALAIALLFVGRGQKTNRQGSANSSETGQAESTNKVRGTYTYQSEKTDSSDLRHFKDAAGRDVSVKKDLTKVVVFSTDAQSYLYMIAPEKLVSVWQGPRAEDYVPSAYASLPTTGKNKASDQKAALLSYQPEVILYVSNGNEKETGTGAMADKLQADFGVPVVEIDSSFVGQNNAFHMFGDFLGKRERDEGLAAYTNDVYRRVTAVAEKEKEKEKKLICLRGSVENEVLLKSAKTSKVMNLLAGNIVEVQRTEAQQRGGSMILEVAGVKQLNPNVILIDTANFLNQMNSDSSWQEIPAIKNTQVYLISSRPHSWVLSPAQYPVDAIWLVNTLYPKQANFDLEREIQQYFKTCYGKNLSAEECQNLLSPQENGQ